MGIAAHSGWPLILPLSVREFSAQYACIKYSQCSNWSWNGGFTYTLMSWGLQTMLLVLSSTWVISLQAAWCLSGQPSSQIFPVFIRWTAAVGGVHLFFVGFRFNLVCRSNPFLSKSWGGPEAYSGWRQGTASVWSCNWLFWALWNNFTHTKQLFKSPRTVDGILNQIYCWVSSDL